MDLLIPLVFIILLSVVYVATQKKTNNKLLSLLAVLALVLLFCFIQMRNEYEAFACGGVHREGFSGCGAARREGFGSCGAARREGFRSKNMAPVDHTMGTCGGINASDLASIERSDRKYDGLVLGASPKPDYALLGADKVAYHSPVGDAYALNPDPLASEKYPSVDGSEDGAKHMFMFAYNKSSPECCPSTFSSSRGCVCMSEAQRAFINKRGSNKTTGGNPDF
jgi:hypothetical protein